MYIFEKSDEKDYYKKTKNFRIESNAVKVSGKPSRSSPPHPCLPPKPADWPSCSS